MCYEEILYAQDWFEVGVLGPKSCVVGFGGCQDNAVRHGKPMMQASFELDLRLNEYKKVNFVEEEIRGLVELSSKSEKLNISTLNGILGFRYG